MDKKDDATGSPLPGKGGKFLYVSFPPQSYGVGKHGNAPAEEGAGLDLQEKRLTSLLQKEIEAAASDGYFRPADGCVFRPGYLFCLDQPGSHGIGQMGMEKHRPFIPFYGHDHVPQV